ncbi:hypothetical protein [Cellulomonas aerilata]|uniref:Uncharacterized protein n=1 Tax=Cellulomonas aerilata TaxID=515326 RepID=A0A512DDK7_9CELL|nr:hypothetical protein [Cellulomonas aerilata]GEO34543.1 hypothetical protein CAE01nite_22680 [Cellulomonas aerilata]
MAHPRRYDDADPVPVRLRGRASRFPASGAAEQWGRPTSRTWAIVAFHARTRTRTEEHR